MSGVCPECGAPLGAEGGTGLCGRCLLGLGLAAAHPAPDPGTAQLDPLLARPVAALGVKFHVLGDYELLEEVARGGMGVVFRARQISLNRTVALKLIAAGRLASPGQVRRFRAEAETAAGLEHPHIVPIYEIGEHAGQHFFTMKLVEGGSLAARIGALGFQITDGEAARLVAIIARAVHFAHQRGVLHRDLKPGNILLDREGQPHVTDFGLAKVLTEGADLTQTVAVLGTPHYMSPEQARGRTHELTTATDIYGLGAVLYELLTGRPPFTGETLVEVLRRVAEEEPLRPGLVRRGRAREALPKSEGRKSRSEDRQHTPRFAFRNSRSEIDRDLETICLKCLEKDAARRYSSAAGLAADLEKWLRHEPIMARPVTARERFVKWTRRNPRLAAMAVVGAVAACLGLAGVLWQWERARRESRRAEQAQTETLQVLRRMEAIELRRADEYIDAGRRTEALPYLALVVRQNPLDRLAVYRLLSQLTHRTFPRLACPPLQHSNRVTFAQFSPDGRRVVTSGADAAAWIWDADTGARLAGPLTHAGEINTAAFSPDGARVVTAAMDRTARIWEATTGQPLSPPLEHDGAVSVVAFSGDGRWLASGSDRGEVGLWDARTGAPHAPLSRHSGSVSGLQFSPDATLLASASHDHTARLWRVPDGELLHELRQGAIVRAVAFHPDGRRLLTAADDSTAQVWDVASAQRAAPPLQHADWVWGAEFSPDGGRVATACHDNCARIWDSATGALLVPPLAHASPVRSVMWSRDGLRLVTGAWDRTARVWNALSGGPLTEPMVQQENVFYAEFHPDGRRLLTAANSYAALIWDITPVQPLTYYLPPGFWPHFGPDPRICLAIGPGTVAGELLTLDLLTGAVSPRRQAHTAVVHSVDFSPDGRRVATASGDGTARVWDTSTGNPVTPPLVHDAGVGNVRFSSSGEWLVTGSPDGTARLWNVRTGQPLAPPLRHGDVTEAQFSADHTRLLTLTLDRQAHLWEAPTGRAVGDPLPHLGPAGSAQFSPDARLVVAFPKARTARLWYAADGKPAGPELAHPEPLSAAVFSPDSRRLLTVSGMAIYSWDVTAGERIGEPLVHPNPVLEARFTPDGRRLLVLTGRGAWMWDVASGRRLSGPSGSPGDFHMARLDRAGRRVVLTLNTGAVELWDPSSGQRLAEPWNHGVEAFCGLFTQDDRHVVTHAEDQTIRAWYSPEPPLPAPAWLADLAEALAGRRFNPDGTLETMPGRDRWATLERMRTVPAGDFYGDWAAWFLAGGGSRTVSPASPLTVDENASRLAAFDTLPALLAAAHLNPTNRAVLARLAVHLRATVTNESTAHRVPLADWLSRGP